MTQSLSRVVPETVVVPRLEMKYTLSQALWQIDEGKVTEARVLVVAAQDILTAARAPAPDPDTLSEAVGLLRDLVEQTRLGTTFRTKWPQYPSAVFHRARAFLDANTPDTKGTT